jgi:HEAT repeat protein
MNSNLQKLADRLEDCITSTEYVRAIRRITRTQDPDAIAILASLLDTPGPVGAAAVRGLIAFGQFAEREMRRCVAEGVDEDAIRNAHRVLAALGDRGSKRAVSAKCWADLEEEAAMHEAAAQTSTADASVG